jgi:type IV pilus assembly protein PilN
MRKIIQKIRLALQSQDPMDQDIVGIDISHNYVRMAQLSKQEDAWTMEKIVGKALPKNEDPEVHRRELIQLLNTLRLEQRFTTTQAAISIPISSAIVQVVQIPLLEDNELKIAVENGSLWENVASISGSVSDYSIFWQVIKKMPDLQQMSLLFVASQINEIEKYCAIVREASFEPLIVDVRCFALQNITKVFPRSAGFAHSGFLELSGYENYIVLIYDDLPFVYDIYVNENDSQALLSGGAYISPDLFERISAQIRSAINSFLSQSGSSTVPEINFASSLLHADRVFDGLKTNMPEYMLRQLNPFDTIISSAQTKSRISTEKNPSGFCVALGLATRRMDIFGYFKFVRAIANINLIPNREQIESNKKTEKLDERKTTIAALASGLASLVLALVYAYSVASSPSLEELETLSGKVADVQSSISQLQSKHDEQNRHIMETALINKKILGLRGIDQIPQGVYVKDYSINRKGTSELRIDTVSADASAQTIAILEKNYEAVKITSAQAQQDKSSNIYTISFKIGSSNGSE